MTVNNLAIAECIAQDIGTAAAQQASLPSAAATHKAAMAAHQQSKNSKEKLAKSLIDPEKTPTEKEDVKRDTLATLAPVLKDLLKNTEKYCTDPSAEESVLDDVYDSVSGRDQQERDAMAALCKTLDVKSQWEALGKEVAPMEAVEAVDAAVDNLVRYRNS